MKSVAEVQNVKQVKANLPLKQRLKVMSEAAYTYMWKSTDFSLQHQGDQDSSPAFRSLYLRIVPDFLISATGCKPG